MERYRLTANIIVKNAESTIELCLDSIWSIADEIIVVDTGSSDGTLEKIKKYDIHSYTFEWQDDFSAARNYAASHSTGDWILIIDADETVEVDRQTVDERMNTDAEGYWVTVKNFLSNDLTQANSQRNLRMFRNRPEYTFQGRIHEQIIPSILQKHSIDKVRESSMLIHHFGYLPQFTKKHEKSQRNIKLLELALKEEPDQPFYFYNLGVEYARISNIDQSIIYLKKCIENEHEKASYLHHAYYLLADNLVEKTEFDQAIVWLQKGIHLYSNYTDLHYLLGNTYLKQYRYEEALQSYYRAIELGDSPTKYISVSGVGGYLSHFQVGVIYQKLGYIKEALQRYMLCIQVRSSFEPAVEKIAQCLVEMKASTHDFSQHLKKIANESGVQAILIVRALCQIGRYEDAVPFIRTIESESLPVLSLKNGIFMKTGQCLEALQIQKKALQKIEQGHSDEEDWFIDQLCCFWSEGLPVPYVVSKRIDGNPESKWLIPLISRLDGEVEAGGANISKDKARKLFGKLVHYGFYDVAERIFTLINIPDYSLLFAKILYQEGYVLKAADRFIQLMEQDQLDSEGTYFLGEIMYERNHYHYAAMLFEKVLAQEPKHWKAKQGASLSYLREGVKWITEAKVHFSHSDLLTLQLHEINESIGKLQQIEWQTKWTERQRRNAHL